MSAGEADVEIREALASIRDWLRYAVTEFNRAGLSYGHGTERAIDEAAFIVLAALSMDVTELDPWLDARLTPEERRRVHELIVTRISTRKPAAYILGFGLLRGYRFKVDERAIVPRSYLGELLADRIDASESAASPFPDPAEIDRVLDLCTGGGSLAVLAALAYPDAHVDAVDISAGALALAAENIEQYELSDRISLHCGDLFAPLGKVRYDLVISNPPYVTDAAVDAFPAEHRAEPSLAHKGGADGLDIVRRIIADAARFLTPTGRLIVEVGSGREALEAAYPRLQLMWHDTDCSSAEIFSLSASDLSSEIRVPLKTKPRRRE